MAGDAGVEPTAFGSGDTEKGYPQNTANLWRSHQFPRLFSVVAEKPASLALDFLHGFSRNLTKNGDKVKSNNAFPLSHPTLNTDSTRICPHLLTLSAPKKPPSRNILTWS